MKKKIAVISGASSGMGREAVCVTAERFPSIGEIWVIARREERLQQLAHDYPGRIRIFPGDLSDLSFIERIASVARAEEVEVCLLVNAAGFGKLGIEGQIPSDETAGMIDVNCRALTVLTEKLLPHCSSRTRIINFASSAAFLPQPGFAVYAATKAYVLSYSYALRRELRKRGITVTAVCPGPVDTEFFPLAEENASTPWYKKLFMVKTKDVVAKAFRDALAGKCVSVYGLPMNGFRALCKILPWNLILKYYTS